MSGQQFLLVFPYSVRYTIYAELGVIQDEAVDLSRRPPCGEWSAREQKLIEKKVWHGRRQWLANQLFYVSRAVSEDSRTMFYAENKFEFARHIAHGLQDIGGFGPLAWRSFRYISIALDKSYHNEANEYVDFKYDDWFRARSLDVSQVLPDWRYICKQLAAYNTRDDWLELRFICDAATRTAAAAFLDPLKDLPRLKDLAIQIGPFWNPGIQEMITATIQEKTKLEASPGPFHFFGLPVELQYRILEQTDLVATKPLKYSSDRGAFIPPHCCGTFSNDPRKDFCTGRAALPCLRTPHMLFLVSKSMRQLAMCVFYSRNVFKVKCEVGTFAPAAAWSAQRSAFLRGFPMCSFHHLRHICWKLPSMPNWAAFWPGYRVTEDWAISLYFISVAVPPGGLTIELVLSFNGCEVLTPETQYHLDYDDAYYDRVVSYMDCLKGRLKDLFIQIHYPRATPWDHIRADRERRLEQRIMGSNYDSFARGKKRSNGGSN
ncbi:hypothetical protein BDW71DRAFT_207233 [Aspergillus fruticulosus]